MKPIVHPNHALPPSQNQAMQVFHDDLEPAAPIYQRVIPESAAHTLALGTTDYGANYYLNGKPLYDGSKIALEVFWGWIEGLFTWTGNLYDQPKLVFFGGQTALVLEPTAVLSWMNPCAASLNPTRQRKVSVRG